MNLTSIMTETRRERVEATLSKIAGEPVEFYADDDGWWAFTDGELGMHRLADKYECRKGWSENLSKFYIRVDAS